MGLEMKYFVLKPKGNNPYAHAARKAMLVYARSIEDHNQDLATELRAWACREGVTANREVTDPNPRSEEEI
jgi:hypothetical protein